MSVGAKTLLAELLDPLLTGFERRRWTWNRKRNGIIDVVELVGSKHGSGDMTVEWGVTLPDWPTVMYGNTDDFHAACVCAIFGRLGDFGGGDRWWTLDAVAEAIPTDMETLVADHLLPFFARIVSLDDLVELVERGYRVPRRSADAPLDDRGRPWAWSWPRTIKQRDLTLAVLGHFAGRGKEAVDAAAAISEWELAGDVAARLRAK